MTPTFTDHRQRFFVEQSPVRGDIVQLSDAYQTIITQKTYPKAVQALLGELMVSASLLIGTMKIDGRLSIQLQSNDPDALLEWAMAECDSLGGIRALASVNPSDDWHTKTTSNHAFAMLGKAHQGVLFINIEMQTPSGSETYQGIVERISDDVGECITYYQKQSAQIPTLIKLATTNTTASGILIQILPQSENDKADDPDLWDRLTLLTSTLKNDELTNLPSREILYRLYHDEQVVLPAPTPLEFSCTCSRQKSKTSILQLGQSNALQLVNERGTLALDCGFCGQVYEFDKKAIESLFANT